MERPDRTLTTWRKSTYSGSNGSNCVEVGNFASDIVMRDTKDRGGPSLTFASATWLHLVTALRALHQA